MWDLLIICYKAHLDAPDELYLEGRFRGAFAMYMLSVDYTPMYVMQLLKEIS